MKVSSIVYGIATLGIMAGCACPPKAPEPVAVAEPPKMAPPPPPAPKPVAMIPKGSIYFDYDKSVVKDKYQPVIEANAKYLKSHPDTEVAVQGNTDERGSNEYNLALGQRRADAVKSALLLQGVRDNQVESVSFGEEQPRASGTDEAAYAENRRVDIDYKK